MQESGGEEDEEASRRRKKTSAGADLRCRLASPSARSETDDAGRLNERGKPSKPLQILQNVHFGPYTRPVLKADSLFIKKKKEAVVRMFGLY
jgi:hypothetical protein